MDYKKLNEKLRKSNNGELKYFCHTEHGEPTKENFDRTYFLIEDLNNYKPDYAELFTNLHLYHSTLRECVEDGLIGTHKPIMYNGEDINPLKREPLLRYSPNIGEVYQDYYEDWSRVDLLDSIREAGWIHNFDSGDRIDTWKNNITEEKLTVDWNTHEYKYSSKDNQGKSILDPSFDYISAEKFIIKLIDKNNRKNLDNEILDAISKHHVTGQNLLDVLYNSDKELYNKIDKIIGNNAQQYIMQLNFDNSKNQNAKEQQEIPRQIGKGYKEMAKTNYTFQEKKEYFEKKNNEFEEKIAGLFIQALEQNTAPWQKPWKPGVNLEDYNYFTMRKGEKSQQNYRGLNSLITEVYRNVIGSEDPRWMTAAELAKYNNNKPKEERMYIKEGSKGIPIQCYSETFYDKDGNKIEYTPENKDKVAKVRTFSKYIFVHNAAQVIKYCFDKDGNALLDEKGKQITKPAFDPIKIEDTNDFKPVIEAEDFLQKTGAKIIHDQTDKAYHSSLDDAIHLPLKKYFTSQENYYNTAFHELTHWTGMPERLDREEFQKYDINKQWRAKEEMVAQIGAYLLCKDLKLYYEPTDNDKDYVKGWSSNLQDRAKFIIEATTKANKASNYLQDIVFNNNKKENINTNINKNEAKNEQKNIKPKGRK